LIHHFDTFYLTAKTREGTDCKSSNVFFVNGKQYFYEVSSRDQKDDGISGTINLCWNDADGNEFARQVSTFHIDGHGNMVRGPKIFIDAAKQPAIK
jgi:hypothetical protein